MSGDFRDELIRRVTWGRSFADVGGLWGTVNEKVSVAAMAGATGLTMVDASVPESPLWERFNDRLTEYDVVGCRNVVGDITNLATIEEVGSVDVVHCSGVLYHSPHPLQILNALREVATEYVILSSAVVQKSVGLGRKRLRVPDGGVLFIPALNEQERRTLADYWSRRRVEAMGITSISEYRLEDFGSWWFLPTPQAVRAMAETTGFEVEEQKPTWNRDATTLLLRVPTQK